jgi:hypothetical protein
MKKVSYYVTFAIMLLWQLSYAQGYNPSASANDFDPAIHPVAVKADSNLILCTVSDYVLTKSLKAQLPGIGQVKDVHCTLHHNKGYLQFETILTDPQRTAVTLFIPLVANPNGAYYAWAGTGTTCISCAGACKPEGSGCGGCCNPVNGLIVPQDIRLKKVATTINLQTE